jgi:hypothetical protein
MHVAMDEEGTPVEEEAPGDDVAAGTAMHEPMEMGGTLPKAGREGNDAAAAMHEHMEWGGEQSSKRKSGTRRPLPPISLDGQISGQLHDQHRCPHVTLAHCLTFFASWRPGPGLICCLSILVYDV